MNVWNRLAEIEVAARGMFYGGLRYPDAASAEEQVSDVCSDLAGRTIAWEAVGPGLIRVLVRRTIQNAIQGATARTIRERRTAGSEARVDSHLWLDVSEEMLKHPGRYVKEIEALTDRSATTRRPVVEVA